MNLFRAYLRWYQSAPTWLIYAANNLDDSERNTTSLRRQKLVRHRGAARILSSNTLSVPSTEPPLPTKTQSGGKVPEHSAPAGRAFGEWRDKYYK